MKKLILAITASLCIATLISSCNNLGISAPKMDSDEATQLIVETLEKNINFDEWKIYEIRWMEADELENNLTVLFVEMVTTVSRRPSRSPVPAKATSPTRTKQAG